MSAITRAAQRAEWKIVFGRWWTVNIFEDAYESTQSHGLIIKPGDSYTPGEIITFCGKFLNSTEVEEIEERRNVTCKTCNRSSIMKLIRRV